MGRSSENRLFSRNILYVFTLPFKILSKRRHDYLLILKTVLINPLFGYSVSKLTSKLIESLVRNIINLKQVIPEHRRC